MRAFLRLLLPRRWTAVGMIMVITAIVLHNVAGHGDQLWQQFFFQEKLMMCGVIVFVYDRLSPVVGQPDLIITR